MILFPIKKFAGKIFKFLNSWWESIPNRADSWGFTLQIRVKAGKVYTGKNIWEAVTLLLKSCICLETLSKSLSSSVFVVSSLYENTQSDIMLRNLSEILIVVSVWFRDRFIKFIKQRSKIFLKFDSRFKLCCEI